MPRFDPPHYLTEHDGLRAREAQHALVNARGHYLGAMTSLVATGANLAVRQGALSTTAAQLSAASKRDTIKANRAAIQAEANKVAPGLVSVNADGTLRINDPISAIDRALSSAFPDVVKAAIDSLPFAGPNAQTLKTKLKTRPLTFFLDVFDPALDALRVALENVMVRGIDNTSAGFKNKTAKDAGPGVGGFVYDLSTLPIPGFLNNPKLRNVNIWLVQPGDELFDDNSRRLLLRVRMVMAYIVLFFKKFGELQAEIVRAGLEFLFGKPDDTLVRVGQGGDGSSFDKPRIVTSMPLCWRKKPGDSEYRRGAPFGPFVIRRYTSGGTPTAAEKRDVTKLVWEIPQYNPKGQQRSFIQLTQEAWDAYQRDQARLSGLGSLGSGVAETTAAKTTADTSTPVAGPSVLDQILAFLVKLGEVLTVVSGAIVAIYAAVNAPKLAEEKTKQAQAEAEAARATQEAAQAQAQAQSAGGVSPALILGGLVVAALLFRKAKA